MASVIDNTTLEGLPALGTQLGDFLGNLGPGMLKFLIVVGIATGVAGIIYAIITVIKSKIKL